jgi:plastocyanin
MGSNALGSGPWALGSRPGPKRLPVLFLVLGAGLSAVTAHAGPVSGTVRTLTRQGAAPSPVVVYAEPIESAAPRRSGKLTLSQKNKAFQPRVLAVPVGSTVEFPNNDQIFHNVFSLSAPQPFDLGLYRAGQTRERTFTAAGTYRVFCNIHPQMTALVVVVPTPYTTLAGADGRYVLDLPPGRYRLTAMSERAAPVSAEITSAAGATAAQELVVDESAWVLAPHKNKFGQEYPSAAYEK